VVDVCKMEERRSTGERGWHVEDSGGMDLAMGAVVRVGKKEGWVVVLVKLEGK